MYQRHWCEHKPSVTISVREEEWMKVGSGFMKTLTRLQVLVSCTRRTQLQAGTLPRYRQRRVSKIKKGNAKQS